MIYPDVPLSTFLNSLQQRGIELERGGDQLYVIRDPTDSLTDEDRHFIRRHKSEILRLCGQQRQEMDYHGQFQVRVASWPEARQRQFNGLVQAYQNPDRGFGIRARPRSREEAIHKAFHELEPIVRQEILTLQTGR